MCVVVKFRSNSVRDKETSYVSRPLRGPARVSAIGRRLVLQLSAPTAAGSRRRVEDQGHRREERARRGRRAHSIGVRRPIAHPVPISASSRRDGSMIRRHPEGSQEQRVPGGHHALWGARDDRTGTGPEHPRRPHHLPSGSRGTRVCLAESEGRVSLREVRAPSPVDHLRFERGLGTNTFTS